MASLRVALFLVVTHDCRIKSRPQNLFPRAAPSCNRLRTLTRQLVPWTREKSPGAGRGFRESARPIRSVAAIDQPPLRSPGRRDQAPHMAAAIAVAAVIG